MLEIVRVTRRIKFRVVLGGSLSEGVEQGVDRAGTCAIGKIGGGSGAREDS